ncbi:SPOR domain-containing protein [Lysobacter auxotrophicus]|uniref:SPOR domain-containing protein n=1 Tax=Lysobacter auxotrophicus TaxID=2992573 RepID=A0ABN6UHN4_9GAMM|nr:SPOR domain-containing protein [Lysobacter auxotrophicus]BDU15814.1 SPOR domain-containing protein [Lysobacter auxotrophicus]
MEPALKQRVIGAVVLIALAVIFLPMLIKGPAPESGASNVPLELPKAPEGDFETRELPLVSPGQAPSGGAVGMNAGANAAEGDTLPTVDTTATAPAAPVEGAMPAATGGGNFAVSFGSYASTADADRVIKALQGAQLTAYQEAVPGNGRTLHRVRIGPFATQAEAEAARLQSGRVRSDVGAKVVVLDAEAAEPVASAPQPAPTPSASVSAPVPLADSRPATQAAAPLPAEPAKPAAKPVEKPVAKAEKPAEKPAAPAPQPAAARPGTPAAAGTGFAVQLGAFGSAAEADKLRDRARSAGFSAFVEQVRTDKGVLNRVRVGPVASRDQADQLKAQVAAKLGVSGIVRPHP